MFMTLQPKTQVTEAQITSRSSLDKEEEVLVVVEEEVVEEVGV